MGEFVAGLLFFVGGLALLIWSLSRRNAVVAEARQAPTEPEPDIVEASESPEEPKSRWETTKPKKTRRPTRDPGSGTSIAAGAGGVMTLLGAGILIASFVYSQDVGEAIVIRTPGGTIAGIDTTPGFSFKAPWNDAVSFDVRNQVTTMSQEGATDGPAITAQTSDNATAAIDITIRYSIIPDQVDAIYQAYRTQQGLIERALDVDVRSIVREIPVRYSAGELRQRRVEVSSDIAKALQERWTRLGVTVDSVDLRDIRYPAEIEQSLAAVQTARSRVDSARAELETSRINAEKIKTEAQAQSDADQIIRCGAMSQKVTEMIAGKELTSVKVVPVPPAQCQNRLNTQVLTSKYIDMLKEAASKGSTVYVIPPDQGSLLQLPAPTQSS